MYLTPQFIGFQLMLISGDPGSGKSVVLRLLTERLQQLRDITIGAIAHPSSNLADFYREMGDLFGVELKLHNRWGDFKVLRERWLAHLEGALLRPVLLIDEAREMHPCVLNELHLLSSMAAELLGDFDDDELPTF